MVDENVWTGEVTLCITERQYGAKRQLSLPVTCQLPKGRYNIILSDGKIPVPKGNVPQVKYGIGDLVTWANKFGEYFEEFKQEIKLDIASLHISSAVKYVCPLCEIEVPKLVKHHYSYFPERTILICSSCNNRNNLENNHPHLNPTIEDADKFYKREKTDE